MVLFDVHLLSDTHFPAVCWKRFHPRPIRKEPIGSRVMTGQRGAPVVLRTINWVGITS
jgi:hypothetical protein